VRRRRKESLRSNKGKPWNKYIMCFSNMLDIHGLVFVLSKPSFIFWWLENGYNHCNLGPSIHWVTQYPITMTGKSLSKNHFPAKRPSFLRNTICKGKKKEKGTRRKRKNMYISRYIWLEISRRTSHYFYPTKKKWIQALKSPQSSGAVYQRVSLNRLPANNAGLIHKGAQGFETSVQSSRV
jgi:hypothetical protein